MSLHKIPKFDGFSELRTANDLVVKLAHDLDRLVASPHDQYAAFDFFITAEHIVDWLHPNCQDQRRGMRSSCAILGITSHIASGAKHFVATDSRHRSVVGIYRDRYASEDYASEGYFSSSLVIQLEVAEAHKLGLAVSWINASDLARLVLDHWINRLGMQEVGSVSFQK